MIFSGYTQASTYNLPPPGFHYQTRSDNPRGEVRGGLHTARGQEDAYAALGLPRFMYFCLMRATSAARPLLSSSESSSGAPGTWKRILRSRSNCWLRCSALTRAGTSGCCASSWICGQAAERYASAALYRLRAVWERLVGGHGSWTGSTPNTHTHGHSGVP